MRRNEEGCCVRPLHLHGVLVGEFTPLVWGNPWTTVQIRAIFHQARPVLSEPPREDFAVQVSLGNHGPLGHSVRLGHRRPPIIWSVRVRGDSEHHGGELRYSRPQCSPRDRWTWNDVKHDFTNLHKVSSQWLISLYKSIYIDCLGKPISSKMTCVSMWTFRSPASTLYMWSWTSFLRVTGVTKSRHMLYL